MHTEPATGGTPPGVVPGAMASGDVGRGAAAEAPAPDAERDARPRSGHRWWRDPRWLALAAAAFAVVALQVKQRGTWSQNFYFDEMWRVDMIRSSDHLDVMFNIDAPFTLGWVLLMSALTGPLPYKPELYRLVAQAFLPLAVGVSSLVLLRITAKEPLDRFGRRPARPVAAVAAGLAPALLTLVPALWRYYYFNNYLFEVAYVAALTWLALSLDERRWAFGALAVGIIGLPVFTIGGILVIPGFLACAAWWVHRSAPAVRRARAVRLAATTAATAIAGLVVYVKLWRPVTVDYSVQSFWVTENTTVGGELSLAGLLRKLVEQAHEQLLGERIMGGPGWVVALATVVLIVSFAVGAASLGRRWPWILIIPASAYLGAVGGAYAAHWPITLERVNLGFYWLVYLCAAYGVLRLLTLPFPRHPALALPAMAALVALLVPSPFPLTPTTYARWLTGDLDDVAASTAPHNVVLAYHRVSHFYVHDRLINTEPDGPERFTVVREKIGDLSLYDPIDHVPGDHGLQPGDMVWCVIPYDDGPDLSVKACRWNDETRVEKVYEQRLTGTWIKGYRVR
ncbi:MAG: hypothetical protein R2726_22835 [Acidimicrobiales bacterium]